MLRTLAESTLCCLSDQVELKIWHGEEYNNRGEQQLTEYLDYYETNIGYMLSFNFNKNKKSGVRSIEVNGKRIVEAVI